MAKQKTVGQIEAEKKCLGLIRHIETCIKGIDEAMKGPSTYQRGAEIAKLTGQLEFAKDLVKHSLGLSLKEPAPKE